MAQSKSDLPHPLPCLLKHVQTVVNVHHKPIIWVLGGPGCGKGTQCKLLKNKYGFTHLSTGELLRSEVGRGGERAEYLQNIMSEGRLVPSDIVLYLLRQAIESRETSTKGFLIDGYPREIEQALSFELVVTAVSLVIYLKTSTDTMMERLRARTAARVNTRLDDREEIFQRRIETFMYLNNNIVRQYPAKLITINAGAPADQVFHEIVKHVDPLVKEAAQYAATHK